MPKQFHFRAGCCATLVSRVVLVLLATLVAPRLPCDAATRQQPNIVLIVADDLGYHDLGCHGSTFYQTPNIDKLASESVCFDRAYAAPTCSPSRAAILSGKNPARLGIVGHGGVRSMTGGGEFLSSDVVTLAEALTSIGYTTCHIGKWHVGIQPTTKPEAQGFQQVVAANDFCCPGSYFYPYLDKQRSGAARDRSAVPDLDHYDQQTHLTTALGNEAARFIASQAEVDQPFFLNLWHYAVHTPIQAESQKVQKYAQLVSSEAHQRNPNYAALVEHLDDSVGLVLTALEEHGLDENTIVIFYSDNGGEVRNGVTSNLPLRSGKGTLYEGGIRVPLFVRRPGVFLPGNRSAFPVVGQDLYPTILALAGQEVDTNELDGVDFSLSLSDPDVILDPRAIHWLRYGETVHYASYRTDTERGPSAAVLKDGWKMIEHFPSPAGLEHRFELFHLNSDPSEANDRSMSDPDQLNKLKHELASWQLKVGVPSYLELAWPAFEKAEAGLQQR